MAASSAAAPQEDLLEVAAGCVARQSSVHREWGDPSLALGRAPTGNFTFHTRLEDHPWWEVDFAATVPVRRIVVWNREDRGLEAASAARPLLVRLAREPGGAWQDLARADYVFGGARSGRPLVIDLAEPVLARLLRLEIDGRSALHLDQVQVYAGAPALMFSHPPALRRVGSGGFVASFRHRHDAGFFSNCSTLLQSVIDLHRSGILVDGIDCSGVFRAFRDTPQDADLYAELFRPDLEAPLPDAPVPRFRAAGDHHGHYRDLDLMGLAPYLRRHFTPAPSVLALREALTDRYRLAPGNLIGLCWRGTDKHKEVAPTDIAEYLALADRILARDPSLRVLVQTDQAQVRDAVAAHFGERCVFFREMPVTEGHVVLHQLNLTREHGLAKRDFAARLLASIGILAGCRHLITHTGNVGLWLALYRGTAEGLYQFDQHRTLVPPPAD